MLARKDFNLLQLLCDYFHTEDDMDGDEVGLTLLRSLVSRYDKLGLFEQEYFDKQHFGTEQSSPFIPPNAVANPALRTSFADFVAALNLEDLTYNNLKNVYEALVGMDSDVRAAPKRNLPLVVSIYCLIFTLLRKMMDYYQLLIQSLFRDPEVAKIRKAYRSLSKKFQKLPYLEITKKALLGHDLSKFEIRLGD